MVTLAPLWLPIVLAAVIVFIASSVILAPLWHRGDYRGVPQEAEFMNSLRPLALPPGLQGGAGGVFHGLFPRPAAELDLAAALVGRDAQGLL